MPNAIVTGATGILGREIISQLGKNASEWPTVHALSRSKTEDFPKNVKHDHIDLMSSADDMAKDLADVRGEYVFFAAYLAKDTEQEAWDVNGAMLSNFLTALVKTGAIKDVKRIVLVTGAKQYGVHLGAVKNPMVEDAPWLTDSEYPPNFYYNQQNILHKFCAEHGKEWTVTYPNDVIGYAHGNFMNLATATALYALVNKELGNDLIFPGSPAFYTKFDSFTCATLHAEFCVWAALTPNAANQAFNVVNGDVESWQNLWPKVANYFGLRVKPDQFSVAQATAGKHGGSGGQGNAGASDGDIAGMASKLGLVQSSMSTSRSSETPLAPKPPIATQAEALGLVGHDAIQRSKVEQQVDLERWAARDDVQVAWEKVADREGLDKEAFGKATWGFLGFVLGRNYDLVISMSKARGAGWKGYKDSWESLREVFGRLEEGGVVPKRK